MTITATSTPTPRQDPAIKGYPWSAEFCERHAHVEVYRVRSATTQDRYRTTIHDTDPDRDRCSCLATKPCWHIAAARLRQQIERVDANAENFYRDWSLAELQREDARLRAVLAGADSWLTRAQYGVVADYICALTREVAA